MDKGLIKAIVLGNDDNVATAVAELDKGQTISLTKLNGINVKIDVRERIPFGHKLALDTILRGANIIKYGEVIGKAAKEIQKGELVHVHNVESRRGRGDKK